METIKCPACRATKQIMGMGMIIHTCHFCSGVGYVEKLSLNKNKQEPNADKSLDDSENISKKELPEKKPRKQYTFKSRFQAGAL